MRVDLDAKVQTRDGEAAGSVQWAVIDPQANEVSDFVISTGGLFGHDVLVPRERLEASSREGDVIRLDLTKDELKRLPVYAPADYTVPATGWTPPAGYGYPVDAFVWPVGRAFEEQAVAARTAREGKGEIWPAIEKGTIVQDRTGEHIGVVDEVRFDASDGHLQAFVVRAGGSIQTFFGGGETIEVARSQVDRVDEGIVYLRAHKRDIVRDSS